MDATNVVTSTDTVRIGYHHLGHPAHQRTITPMTDDHRALDTRQVNMMTRSRSRSNIRIHHRDRSTSRSRHPSTDRHASRDRNTCLTTTEPGAVHPTDSDRAITRPPTLYTRHNSRSRSSSCNIEKPHRCSVTIQDNPADNDDQEYNNVDDYFDEDLN